MKNSIIFISALSLVAMMLAPCEGISSAYNPLPDKMAAEMATTIERSEGPPVPGETLKPRP